MKRKCGFFRQRNFADETIFFPSIGIRPCRKHKNSTARPEALDKACFILAGIDEKSLLQQ
jgi:UDP-N-acetylglucosamine 2-epimerase (non-hydrolysing)